MTAIQELGSRGYAIVYLSIRPESAAQLTIKQLADAGLPEGQVIYGCPIARWNLVTAPHSTTPFRTSSALEVDGTDPNVIEKLREQAE